MSKQELIHSIISDLKSLMGALKIHYPNDLKLMQISNRINILIDADPALVATKVGEEMSQHAEKIYEMEFTPDLAAHINTHFKLKPKNAETADYAAYVLNRINIFITEVPDQKCRKYVTKIIDMLNKYIDYTSY